MLVRGDGVSVSAVEPPGFAQDGAAVTMCFTDIQSSTELWESYPQGMHTALQQHNDSIRRVAKERCGYEVKVIGDSFMLAFRSAEEACLFAVEVQEELAAVQWPSELLQHPLCRRVEVAGEVVWCGPRVRIGLNCGAVRVEKNPVTGRCDYFGPTVNTAARVEACLRHGGLIGVTQPILDELTPAGIARLGAVQESLGLKELKGVSGLVEVTVLISNRQSERRSVLPGRGVREQQRPSDSASSEASVTRVPSGCSLNESHRHRRAAAAGAAAARARPATLGLSKRTGSCGCFRVCAAAEEGPMGGQVAAMLAVVESAADATQGVVASVLSVHCVVAWNAARACHDHYSQCLAALDYVRRAGMRCAAGAATGELLYGNLAAGRKKHATIIGPSVEDATAAAAAAEREGEAAVAAASFAPYCDTQHRTSRQVEVVCGRGMMPAWVLTECTGTGWECDGDADSSRTPSVRVLPVSRSHNSPGSCLLTLEPC
eukprot:TRINITY_DN1818_c3_g3_i1.p1 TRINITY_DN1818_c3_g3~~TRINITY_DN1818_c3_g3_i1.p1  ORF type:complete len:488 (+),score=130.00 TRINITY_DN1818_c3_g3_i1:1002-2465(+)